MTEYVGQELYTDLSKEVNETYANIVELSKNEYETKKGYSMIIEFDGSMLRQLLESTKGTEWKELKLGCIFIKNNIGKIIKKEYISYPGNAQEFKKYLFHLAIKMNYMQMETIQVIADGAHWIWNICKELFPNAIEVLDYYHCKENVYEYYNYIYQTDEKKAEKEAKKIMNKIENEVKITTIMHQIPTIEVLPSGIVNLTNYLLFHSDRIKYKTFTKQGLDIGSGVIEGGNKNIIQHRMKQTGMMWNKDSIEAISTLRCKLFSNHWDDIVQKIQSLCPVLS